MFLRYAHIMLWISDCENTLHEGEISVPFLRSNWWLLEAWKITHRDFQNHAPRFFKSRTEIFEITLRDFSNHGASLFLCFGIACLEVETRWVGWCNVLYISGVVVSASLSCALACVRSAGCCVVHATVVGDCRQGGNEYFVSVKELYIVALVCGDLVRSFRR